MLGHRKNKRHTRFLSVAHREGLVTRRQADEVLREVLHCQSDGLPANPSDYVHSIYSGDLAVELGIMDRASADRVVDLVHKLRRSGQVVKDIVRSGPSESASGRRTIILWSILAATLPILSILWLRFSLNSIVLVFASAFLVALVAIVEILTRSETPTRIDFRSRMRALLFVLWAAASVHVLYCLFITDDPDPTTLKVAVGFTFILSGLTITVAWVRRLRLLSALARVRRMRSLVTYFTASGCRDVGAIEPLLTKLADIVAAEPLDRFIPIWRKYFSRLPFWRRHARVVTAVYLVPDHQTRTFDVIAATCDSVTNDFITRSPDSMFVQHIAKFIKEKHHPVFLDVEWFVRQLVKLKDKRGRSPIAAFRREPGRARHVSLAGSVYHGRRMYCVDNVQECRSFDDTFFDQLGAVERAIAERWFKFASLLAYPVPLPSATVTEEDAVAVVERSPIAGVLILFKNVRKGFTAEDKSAAVTFLRLAGAAIAKAGARHGTRTSVIAGSRHD